MKGNGRSRAEFALMFAMENKARSVPAWTRLGFLLWLLRWGRRPGRVFWEMDPSTGEWRQV